MRPDYAMPVGAGESRVQGARPGAVEGSDPGTVVGVQAGDHAAPGGALDTVTVGQLIETLDGLPADMPVRLEVLGDVIDTDGVVIDHEVRIVGGETEE